MNDERTAERTQHLMPELDACAAAILVYEQAFLALQSCSWVRSAKRSRLEFELRRAECGWRAAKHALNERTRVLGIATHKIQIEIQQQRSHAKLSDPEKRARRAARQAARNPRLTPEQLERARAASTLWAKGALHVENEASRMKRLGDV